MKTQKQEKKVKVSKGVPSSVVILLCAVIAFCFFYLVCGSPSNFDEKGHPLNTFGTLFQGGFVIPIVLTLLFTVLTLSVERFFALNKMRGKKNLSQFVYEVKAKLEKNDIKGAEVLCADQKGSVANILKAALIRYEDVEKMTDRSNDEKSEIIQKEIEDATALELPSLEQNLNIIATISTLGTLMGLLGTVLGMIRSFGAMGQEGAPDSTALAIGISEALLNTATGIATGALAIIFYNFYAQKVQNITNAVDEIGFAIGQTYTKTHEGK
jgi:biopolymer transport protein ExbB